MAHPPCLHRGTGQCIEQWAVGRLVIVCRQGAHLDKRRGVLEADDARRPLGERLLVAHRLGHMLALSLPMRTLPDTPSHAHLLPCAWPGILARPRSKCHPANEKNGIDEAKVITALQPARLPTTSPRARATGHGRRERGELRRKEVGREGERGREKGGREGEGERERGRQSARAMP